MKKKDENSPLIYNLSKLLSIPSNHTGSYSIGKINLIKKKKHLLKKIFKESNFLLSLMIEDKLKI